MSTLILSLLLLLLIAAGMMMVKPIHEHFVSSGEEPQLKVSPALMNLLATPALAAANTKPLQVDTLEREKDLKKAVECPDMSNYIRLDEIPCWNCSLP